MLTHPMLNIRILFTNYDTITDFLNLAFCSEHYISIKHRILATFNVNKTFNSDSLCDFKFSELVMSLFFRTLYCVFVFDFTISDYFILNIIFKRFPHHQIIRYYVMYIFIVNNVHFVWVFLPYNSFPFLQISFWNMMASFSWTPKIADVIIGSIT